jgi:cardiolipin synthase
VTAPGLLDQGRVVTIPNVITLVRLACIPVFLWLLFGRDDVVAAAWLLAALGSTDWVDGYIARRFNQVSDLGKVLDPTADRLLFIVCVGGIIVYGAVPLWFGLAVVAREVLLGGTLAVLTLFGMKRFDVTYAGKLGTALLMLGFPLLLVGTADVRAADLWRFIGWGFGLAGLTVSWYAAITYIPTIRASWAEGRKERRR